MARIFAPGFTTKIRGSGVGLAVTNRVVAAHHGRILVDSEVERGTTITVVLPSDLGGFSSLATPVSRAEP
jgi:two-component system NtrC family sensor kinase